MALVKKDANREGASALLTIPCLTSLPDRQLYCHANMTSESLLRYGRVVPKSCLTVQCWCGQCVIVPSSPSGPDAMQMLLSPSVFSLFCALRWMSWAVYGMSSCRSLSCCVSLGPLLSTITWRIGADLTCNVTSPSSQLV